MATPAPRRKASASPDFLTQAWLDRFAMQDESIAELVRTIRGFNGTAGLVERLARIETSQAEYGNEIKAIHTLLISSIQKPEKPDNEKQPLTRGQLAVMVMEASKPILTAVVIWALLTFFPELIQHLKTP